MFYKIILLLFLIISVVHAELCPDITDIKNDNLYGWQAYTLDNGEPLSDTQMATLKKHIRSYDYAGWLKDAPEGEAECYYKDAYIKGRWGVYFAKAHLKPAPPLTHWQSQGSSFLKCAYPREQCVFSSSP